MMMVIITLIIWHQKYGYGDVGYWYLYNFHLWLTQVSRIGSWEDGDGHGDGTEVVEEPENQPDPGKKHNFELFGFFFNHLLRITLLCVWATTMTKAEATQSIRSSSLPTKPHSWERSRSWWWSGKSLLVMIMVRTKSIFISHDHGHWSSYSRSAFSPGIALNQGVYQGGEGSQVHDRVSRPSWGDSDGEDWWWLWWCWVMVRYTIVKWSDMWKE